MNAAFTRRGFLPEPDPVTHFPHNSEFARLDKLGGDLPSMLQDAGFRAFVRNLTLPAWPDEPVDGDKLPYLRLYYLRLGFLASAYINQVPLPPESTLPRNIAVPLCNAGRLLNRPPILSYDGYALYNWKRFRPGRPHCFGQHRDDPELRPHVRRALVHPCPCRDRGERSPDPCGHRSNDRAAVRRQAWRGYRPRIGRDREGGLGNRWRCCGASRRRWTRTSISRRFARTSASSRTSSMKAWFRSRPASAARRVPSRAFNPHWWRS